MVGGFLVFNYQGKQNDGIDSDVSERDTYITQFEDQSIEIAFDYPDGPGGYTVDDLTNFVDGEPQGIEIVKVYRIMNTKEKIELENSEGGREGPPLIQLMVFRNDLNQSASMWVDAFPAFSNIGMVLGEADRNSVVGGANAVQYTTDGLYVTDNVVIASGDFVYHFSGSYHERDSVIHQDFKALVDSIRFIPSVDSTGGAAKIDVRVACESALAYMLFETGEQAEQFVAECVAGEHPDVIERYINDMGLDGATI